MKYKLGPASALPTLFIGKWTVKIIYLLKKKPHRHGELRRRLGNVSQRMLTRTLRNLESTGLIDRKVTRTKSVAVEYSLTKLGRSFITPLSGVCHWADRHRKELGAIVRLQKGQEKQF
jgi:DNA-binding HxlR family transcriptional regulator